MLCLIIWKVGMTRTYANENEEQFAGRISQNSMTERL